MTHFLFETWEVVLICGLILDWWSHPLVVINHDDQYNGLLLLPSNPNFHGIEWYLIVFTLAHRDGKCTKQAIQTKWIIFRQ